MQDDLQSLRLSIIQRTKEPI